MKYWKRNKQKIDKLTRERDIYIDVYKTKEMMYTNQTGKFPGISSQGNKYIMVLVNIDSNSI